ncbi:MAG: carbohydrate ABC transporter permease [Clostridia bacterium]|nr:carbohydrate ABC transporter permease [Clostridia bacterium]MBR2968902.1 carbohydrate ABC transporter permease [Clostridia bacterium]
MVENTGKDKVFNWIIYLVMGIYAFITLLPLLFVLANSFSNPILVYRGEVGLIPKEFSLDGYANVFRHDGIIRGYLNTLMYTVIGTVIQLVLQFTAAYPLSRRDLKGKGVVNLYFVLTMFLSGGMIPTYFVVKNLQLINTIWAMIIPGCVGVYNIIIIRTYISSTISWEYQEAAMIDGAGPIKTFVSIIIPLCKPIIAVMTLYAIVGYWNSYFNSLLYLPDDKYWPLQRWLTRILINSNTGDLGSGAGQLGQQEQAMLSESIKYVVIVVATVPILLIYPFFQKFFEKGLMVGGLKG